MSKIQHGVTTCVILLASCILQSCTGVQNFSKMNNKMETLELKFKIQDLADTGRKHMQNGEYNEALTSIDEALRLDPDCTIHQSCIWIWQTRCQILGEMHRVQEALTCYDKTIAMIPETSPDSPQMWNQKCLYLQYTLARYPEALACYDKVLQLDPREEHAKKTKVHRCDLFGQMGNRDAKLKCFKQIEGK